MSGADIAISLIGIGTGNPDHVTRAAVTAMNAADLILLPRKGAGKSDLVDLRRTICTALLTGPAKVVEFDLPERDADAPYRAAVDAWHDEIAAVWAAQIAEHLPGGGGSRSSSGGTRRSTTAACGSPSGYARGRSIGVSVVPGITSLQALTAAHAIPLNTLAAPVTITTGRRLRAEGGRRGWRRWR
ncbi:SAM-dependent methyltransferase [Sphingomonas aerolata]